MTNFTVRFVAGIQTHEVNLPAKSMPQAIKTAYKSRFGKKYPKRLKRIEYSDGRKVWQKIRWEKPLAAAHRSAA